MSLPAALGRRTGRGVHGASLRKGCGLKGGTDSRAVDWQQFSGRLSVYSVLVDASNCERCFDCVTACPRGVLEEGEMHPVVVLGVCREDGLHVEELPQAAGFDRLPVVA